MEKPLGSGYLMGTALGRGAMGQVYAGSVRQTGDSVAIKVLKPELVSDPEVVARFVQERAILTSVADQNVVRVIDLVVEGETLAIVMELVEGSDLRRYLRQQRTVPPAEAARLAGQLLHGAAAVHAAGIIHRDIKPENLLLDMSSGEPLLKLTDFGVARLSYGASLTKLSGLIGTPEYMAPELAEKDSATAAADVYSVGIVVYEMLCGRTPFAGGHPLAVLRRQVDEAPPPIPGVPAELWEQVSWMLAKDPQSRPASAAEAAAALAPLGSSLAALPALPPRPGPEAGTPVPSPAIAGQDPAGSVRHATVLRYRDRGDSPDRDGSGSVASQGAGAEPLAPATTRSWLRSTPAIAALAVGLAAVLAVAAELVLPRLHAAPKVASPAAASYAFAPQRYRDGVLIVRRWTLSGRKGSVLTETVMASSTTGQAMSVQFQEAIPQAIAPTLRSVRFNPAPAKIVRADPVVEWRLQLPAQGSVTVGYHSSVPPDGTTRARLARWAGDLRALQAHLPSPQATPPASRAQPSPTPSLPVITQPTSPGLEQRS